ncbi:MAG: tRNA pseudouridine(38-40) synthase TruA [Chlamydiales bacterium]
MKKNVALVLAYDGTKFLGWQQTSMGPSIEETLMEILEQILQEKVALQAASRTDAGVHADGQVVNFFTHKIHLDTASLMMSLNRLLPKSISVIQAKMMPPQFHPTLDAIGKKYYYSLCLGSFQLPKHRFFSWHVPYPLDRGKMETTARYFIGEHDFSAFCNQLQQVDYQHKNRKIFAIDLFACEKNRMRIEVSGNQFLYKMVRNIVGTLVHAGMGRLSPEKVLALLSDPAQKWWKWTAPAHALVLKEVFYLQENRIDV